MTTAKFQNFIQGHFIEYHWNHDKSDVYICLDFDKVQTFYELLSKCIFDDEGVECQMKNGYFVFSMTDICEYYGLNINEIFTKQTM
jgi:hypothetical protein